VAKDKQTPEAKLVADLNKEIGDEAAMLMGIDGAAAIKAVCPTGLTVLDRWILGVGGVPYGRIVEVFGMESAGKSTLMNRMLAGVQRDGGVAMLIETEQKYDPTWARLHGVDVDRLVLAQPRCLEEALREIELVVDRADKVPHLVALDSVAATPTRVEVEKGEIGEPAMAMQARVWSDALKKLIWKIGQSQAIVLLLNQVRSKPGVMYGPTETTPCGNAIKFYASTRLQVSHGKSVAEGNEKTGRYLTISAMKNNFCPPYRKGKFRLDFAEGFDDDWSILEHAKEMGIVTDKCRSVKEARQGLSWDEAQSQGVEP